VLSFVAHPPATFVYNAACNAASPQNSIPNPALHIIALVLSRNVRLNRSASPFDCGVYGVENVYVMPFCFKYTPSLTYSFALSECRRSIGVPVALSIHASNSLKHCPNWLLLLIIKTFAYRLGSTIKQSMYRAPPIVCGSIGPIISECTTCLTPPFASVPVAAVFVCFVSTQVLQSMHCDVSVMSTPLAIPVASFLTLSLKYELCDDATGLPRIVLSGLRLLSSTMRVLVGARMLEV